MSCLIEHSGLGRVHGCAGSVSVYALKWKQGKNGKPQKCSFYEELKWTARHIARQGQPQARPELRTALSVQARWEELCGPDPCRWHKRVGPRQLPVWQPTQKMERNTCFFQCSAIFASLLKILAPADSSLMASGNTVVGGRSLSLDKQRFSGDYEHLTQLNLALI